MYINVPTEARYHLRQAKRAMERAGAVYWKAACFTPLYEDGSGERGDGMLTVAVEDADGDLAWWKEGRDA